MSVPFSTPTFTRAIAHSSLIVSFYARPSDAEGCVMSSLRRGSRNAGSAACTKSASARHVAESQDSSTGLRAIERSRGREAYASVGRPGVRGPRRPDPPRRPRTARRRQRDDQRARRALRHVADRKKHIRLLEEAEVVTTEKVGRVRRCMLTPYAFEGISMWLQRLDRFARVVERT